MSHTSHSYNTRNNNVNNEENENDPAPKTSDLIINLEKKLISRFDGVDKEILNLKDVIIKNLQIENQRLRTRVNVLENKVLSLEISSNHLEQYGRRNNLEISGIADDVSDENLECKVIEVLKEIQVDVATSDIEACHRIGKSKNSSKKTIVRFVNRKHAKKALLNRKNLRKSVNCKGIFINENLTKVNNSIAYNCRKLKRNDMIEKTYSREGVIHISGPKINNGKVIKVLHMNILFDLFPDYEFNDEERGENQQEHDDSLQSSY